MEGGTAPKHGDTVMISMPGSLSGKLCTLIDTSIHAQDGEGGGMAKVQLHSGLQSGHHEKDEDPSADSQLNFVW